jgi:lysozyme family protein
MSNINRYNEFLLDKEFESITNEIFLLVENGKQLSDNSYVWDMSKKSDDIKSDDEKPVTFEWDLKKKDEEKPITFEWDLTKKDDSNLEKLKRFLEKLPKEKLQEYFFKFLNKLKFLPEKLRRKVMINYAGIFLSLVSITFLLSGSSIFKGDEKIVKEFIKVTKKASFDVSQKIVSLAEGGYSNDRKDTGNFVEFEMGGKKLKRFIGSKYGISAPILQKYLGRLPKKQDMINLSYDTALEIYKNKYWDDQKIERFCNQSIANIVYDGCVNQGVNGTKIVLRNVLRENGIKISDDENPFEMDYIKQLNSLEQDKLFNSIKKFREYRYKQARTFDEHGGGWLDRLEKLQFVD